MSYMSSFGHVIFKKGLMIDPKSLRRLRVGFGLKKEVEAHSLRVWHVIIAGSLIFFL